MPTIPSDGSSSRLRSTGSILFPSLLEPQCERSWSSLAYDNRISAAYPDIGPDGQAITLRTDYASPISPCVMPLNKGWEDIKRFSIGSSSTVSPISKSPPYVFSPPSLDVSPPQPLKKRSLVQIRRKTLLADTGQAMTQTPYSPLSVRTFFTHNSNASFEGLRMSLLAKMNSIGDARDNHAMSPSSKTANSLWYRDSITRNAQQHWGPDDVGRRF
ncbi:hypothetical protein EJ02DRAFT_455248 [Clathrospora elynae]|uniref:Uncharacterized protein n=1 Tax=Clathrospora elynae TaxID=706981 RepID=A0A6A5SNN0_9PLEO|nr:hypothetical protein EJ02DRAFT_455248 [Clathrospora elynae]